MGGRAKQSSSTTTTTQLPTNQQQNVDTLQGAAGEIFKSGGPTYYPGQTYATPTPNETAGRSAQLNYAGGTGQNFVNQYRNGEQYWLDPNNIFNPDNTPGFRNAQQDVIQTYNNNLNRNILPAIRGGAVANGSLGGSRGAIAEGLAVGDSSRALASTLANMDMAGYTQGLQQYNNAAARAPATYGLGLAPGSTQQTIGGQERADAQTAIDASVNRYNFDQLRPILNAQTLQALTGTAGQYGGTTTSNTTQQVAGGNSGLTQGLGGLLTILPLLMGGKQ
jgi:hypothetical protein